MSGLRSSRCRGVGVVASCVEALEGRRLLSGAGTLDTNFNTTGIVEKLYKSDANDAIDSVVQPDGKVVVIGDADDGFSKDIVISRFNADGSEDTSFGTNGKFFFDLNFDEIGTSVRLQPDGKIVFGGFSENSNGTVPTSTMIVGRLNADGTFDSSFNLGNGFFGFGPIQSGGFDVCADVAIDPTSGVIYAGGSSGSATSGGVAVVAITPDGQFDTAFGSNGIAVGSSSGLTSIDVGTGMAWTPSGLLLSGFEVNAIGQHSRMIVTKFTLAGAVDTTFGTSGTASASFGRNVEIGADVAVDPANGSIYVTGTTADGSVTLSPGVPAGPKGAGATAADFALARFTAAGMLDTTFGTGGKVTRDFSGGLDGASGVVVQSDGKVLVAGGTEVVATGKSDFASCRFNTDGTIDVTYGTSGDMVADLGGSDGAFQVRLDPDGTIYLVGHSKGDSGNFLAVIRELNDAAAPKPVLLIGDASASNITSPGNLTFTVGLSSFSRAPVTVHYATADGTAHAGTQYTATSGDLTFAPGETRKTIAVPYGASPNGNVGFTVDLADPSGATIGDAAGAGSLGGTPTSTNALQFRIVIVNGLPPTIIGGAKNAKGTAMVTLLNTTDAKLTGKAVLSIYGSPDDALSTSSDLFLGKASVSLKLISGNLVTFKVPVTIPKVSADSALTVFATGTGAGIADASSAFIAGTAPVNVVKPSITLAGSSSLLPAVSARIAKKFNASFPLTDTGNVDAAGTLQIDVHITVDGTDSTLKYYFFTKAAKVALKANRPGKISLSFTAPTSQYVTPGDYIVTVTIKSSALNAANTTDGTRVATIPLTLS